MSKSWNPVFQITPQVASDLMTIEAIKVAVESFSLPISTQDQLRYNARVRSSHYSTRIEGNRLTLKEAEQIISQSKTTFLGRERDVKEVQNYWEALIKVEEWANQNIDFTEELICKIHSIVDRGRRTKPSPYRDGQNVIKDSRTGAIVYLPPEAKDVGPLMRQMVSWVKNAGKLKIPPPVLAALVHYQFVTIHPFYDGNGRTARLLATFILKKEGYGLNGFLSLEEYHAKDLEGYYKALATHHHHNYYFGRAQVDLTPWIEYFMKIIVTVFEQVKKEVAKTEGTKPEVSTPELQKLDLRAKTILPLFIKHDQITIKDMSRILGLSDRMTRNLARRWVSEGLLIVINKPNRNRSYGLAEKFKKYCC